MTALALHRYGPDDGMPLVLLHGFPLDSRMWGYAISALPTTRVVAVDAPGFGDSPLLPPGASGLEDAADAVASALAGAGIERAVVAGLSMGGYLALALAERRPELFAGIGLLDTKASADADAARAKRLEVAAAARGPAGADAVAPMLDTVLGATTRARSPELVAEVRDWLSQAPPSAIAWTQEAMAARPDRHAALAALAARGVPGLVLRGEEDEMATAADHDRMAEALGVRTVVVPGAGHLAATEAPAATARALADLVRAASA